MSFNAPYLKTYWSMDRAPLLSLQIQFHFYCTAKTVCVWGGGGGNLRCCHDFIHQPDEKNAFSLSGPLYGNSYPSTFM